MHKCPAQPPSIGAEAERHDHYIPVIGNADAHQRPGGINRNLISVEIKGSRYFSAGLGVFVRGGGHDRLTRIARGLSPRAHVDRLGHRVPGRIIENEGLVDLPGGGRGANQVKSGIVARHR